MEHTCSRCLNSVEQYNLMVIMLNLTNPSGALAIRGLVRLKHDGPGLGLGSQGPHISLGLVLCGCLLL